jgi:hypothetical protein
MGLEPSYKNRTVLAGIAKVFCTNHQISTIKRLATWTSTSTVSFSFFFGGVGFSSFVFFCSYNFFFCFSSSHL